MYNESDVIDINDPRVPDCIGKFCFYGSTVEDVLNRANNNIKTDWGRLDRVRDSNFRYPFQHNWHKRGKYAQVNRYIILDRSKV